MLSLTIKNNEPEVKATRKVRQKTERAKALFVMILDRFVTTLLAMTGGEWINDNLWLLRDI